jgi:tripeptide aminopeptidase
MMRKSDDDVAPTAVDDLLELIRIHGNSGEEGAVAAFICERLFAMGVPGNCILRDDAHRNTGAAGSVGNLIVSLNGNRLGERIMLSAHMDTVPLAVGAQPKIDGHRIVNAAAEKALGGDDRAGCAVLLHVARVLSASHGCHSPVTLVFFVQEEIGLLGSEKLDSSLLGEPTPSRCYNFDSGGIEEFLTAITGAERFQVEVAGRPEHAGLFPERGISAAVIAAHALSELVRDGWHGRIKKFGREGSANLGIIQGGDATNTIMGSLRLFAEARSHDADFRKQIIAAWQESFDRVVGEVVNENGNTGAVRFSRALCYEAFETPEFAPIIEDAVRAARQIGLNPRCIRSNGGTDSNRIAALGIPSITLACGQRNIHRHDEYVDLSEFQLACRLALALVGVSIS